jgi:hypothetical protein
VRFRHLFTQLEQQYKSGLNFKLTHYHLLPGFDMPGESIRS